MFLLSLQIHSVLADISKGLAVGVDTEGTTVKELVEYSLDRRWTEHEQINLWQIMTAALNVRTAALRPQLVGALLRSIYGRKPNRVVLNELLRLSAMLPPSKEFISTLSLVPSDLFEFASSVMWRWCASDSTRTALRTSIVQSLEEAVAST